MSLISQVGGGFVLSSVKRKEFLELAHGEVTSDVYELEKLMEERFTQGKPVDYLGRLINTIKSRDIIGFYQVEM